MVIISKEKLFVDFKKIWASVVNEAHKISYKTWVRVDIAAYSPGATQFIHDSSNIFDTINKFLNYLKNFFVKRASFIWLPLERVYLILFTVFIIN